MYQFHCRYAQRPNIGFEVVASLLDNLRCHPEWCSNKSVAERFDVSQLSSNTKVCQLDLSRLRKKDICSFDVSVKLPLRVKVGQAKKQLSADDGDVRFFERSRFELLESMDQLCGVCK